MTPAEGRRFGLTVGAAFLAFAAAAAWRGHLRLAILLAVPGGALSLAGLLLPTRLGPIERGWMAAARAISRVTTPVVMSVMYLVVLFPVGVLRRAFGGNPLVHREGRQGFWRERPEGTRRSASMRRQF